MKRILWLSRHRPLPVQIEELHRLWPGCEIAQNVEPFGDAAEIVRRIRRGGYDEIVVVAPLSVLDQLCQRGVRPIRAEMDQIQTLTDPTREVEAPGGRIYRFREFRHVVRLELVTEEL